jgi:hypothetical protein
LSLAHHHGMSLLESWVNNEAESILAGI